MKIHRNQKMQRLFALIAAFAITLVYSVASSAQNYPNQNYPGQYQSQQDDAYVTIFEDCNFRGKSRSLALGDYSDWRGLDIRNDSVSSIQVPPGLQITLFRDDRFRGKSIVLDRDEACLNKNWNDQASSFQVKYTAQNQSRQGQYQNRPGQYQGAPGQYQSSPQYNQNANTAAVSRVVFANTALESLGGQQWRIVNANGSVENYRELNRDARSIYLQNTATGGRVQIDLFANNVVFVAPNGNPVNYQITRVEQGNPNNFGRADRNPARAGDGQHAGGLIQNRCFSYSASTRGGDGGIRFHGHEGFNQFQQGAHSGRICHDGNLTMEVSKTQPSTEVVVEIEGQQYLFSGGDEGDSYLNNWYRKNFSFRVNSN